MGTGRKAPTLCQLLFSKSSPFLRRQHAPPLSSISTSSNHCFFQTSAKYKPQRPKAGKMTAVATPPTFHISFDGPAGMTFPSFPSSALEGGDTKKIMLEMIRNACNM